MEQPSIEDATWIAHCLGRAELAPLEPQDVAALATKLSADDYPAGATLFQEGQAPARVHIIHSGAVELSCGLKGRQVVLQILRSGDVVGDVPLFLRMTEAFDAVANRGQPHPVDRLAHPPPPARSATPPCLAVDALRLEPPGAHPGSPGRTPRR